MVKDPATDRYTGAKFVADWLAAAMIKNDSKVATLPSRLQFKTGVAGPRIVTAYLNISDANLSGIPFKFVGKAANICIEGCWVDNLKFLPPYIGELYIGCGLYDATGHDLPPMEYRYLLLMGIGTLITDGVGDKFHKILMEGRVNGEMPSELIPGKIAQLRALQ